MEIIWNPNPVKTQVFATDRELDRMLEFIHYDELRMSVYRLLRYPDEYEKNIKNLESVYKKEDYDYNDEREYCKHSLENGVHIGDCTCVAMSCSKCHAEYNLGISTIDLFSKHQLRIINGAFSKEGATIDSVIYFLKNDYAASVSETIPDTWKMFTQEQYNGYRHGWIQDAANASLNLEKYKILHSL